jgi:hypothetical protein
MNGQFVISLDFEKYWGIFDSLGSKNYGKNIEEVDNVIERLLTVCDHYNVKLTFATVGLLFNKTKEEFMINTPSELPSYSNKNHSPYSKFDAIGENELSDNFHYGNYMLKKIAANGNHEIGTHTYCHYYCLEEGQTVSQFEADLKMAIKVAADNGVEIKSIVFPRNQVSQDYLKVCHDHGILSYRGNENHAIYAAKPYIKSKNKAHRLMRVLDSYINITGNHIYDLNALITDYIVNIPSSCFLRPYNEKLSYLEPLKINRVINGMTKAAKNKQLYHLWWHPHNFGKNIEENFNNLETILKAYSKLNQEENFESVIMTELALKLKK